MTSTTATKPGLTDASLLPSPEWCDFSGNYHRDLDEDPDAFGPARVHVIEFEPVEATSEQPGPGTRDRPYAVVCVAVPEKTYYDHGRLDDPRVTLAATGYPHFTASEARQLADTLIAAADRADEIVAWRTPRSQAA